MLPFVFLDEQRLGPFHPYGIAVALAFFTWDWALMRFAVRRGFDRDDFRALSVWMMVTGTLFAFGVDALFYGPHAGAGFGLQGFSSTGGLVGAVVGGVVWRYVRVGRTGGRWKVTRRAAPIPLLPVSEVVVGTWPIAFAFGRLGCALIHDHPGTVVPKGTLASLFAVAWPTGPDDGVHHVLGPLHVVTGGSVARFDLGLVELLVLAPLAVGFALSWQRDVAMGTYTAVASLVYGPVRFALDFLRPDEQRHGGLTFAQYFSLALVALGLALVVRRFRRAAARRRGAPSAARAPSVLLCVAFLAALLAPRSAAAAPPWVERPIVLPRHVFAFDVGLGLGGAPRTRDTNWFGPGMNLEALFAVTDTVELGLRTGIRLTDDAKAAFADEYGRTIFTETYGTGRDTVANPEFYVRWAVYQGRVAEVALDGRIYIPIEQNTRFGMMFGVPLAFHVADFLRIDTGPYIPVVFNDPTFAALSIPGDFWFQASDRVFLGPMSGIRFFNNGRFGSETDVLLGFGLGFQISSGIDLKSQIYFPRINQEEGGRTWGFGVGLQFRIE